MIPPIFLTDTHHFVDPTFISIFFWSVDYPPVCVYYFFLLSMFTLLHSAILMTPQLSANPMSHKLQSIQFGSALQFRINFLRKHQNFRVPLFKIRHSNIRFFYQLTMQLIMVLYAFWTVSLFFSKQTCYPFLFLGHQPATVLSPLLSATLSVPPFSTTIFAPFLSFDHQCFSAFQKGVFKKVFSRKKIRDALILSVVYRHSSACLFFNFHTTFFVVLRIFKLFSKFTFQKVKQLSGAP